MSDEKDQEQFVSEQDQQDFARQQYQFLKDVGIENRMERSRIFKAAGPGQVQEAWKLATCEDFTTEEGQIRKSLLHCILAGSNRVRYDRETMEEVLKLSGFYVPTAHNDRCFFRVLNGAGEILSPGFFRFSHKDMRVIKDGLKKRIHEED